MSAVSSSLIQELRPRIAERRARLKAAAGSIPEEYVRDLLAEVDAALLRIDGGSYGMCEYCHETIEADRLARDPLARFCLDHLNREQRRAHEQDLELATRIQSRLLPARDLSAGCWQTHYRYQPAGLVGGDYCEIVAAADGESLFFAVGDVAGKGVAASLLMTHLSAIFRSLLSLDLAIGELMGRANRLFCEGTPDTHYATLAAGRAGGNGVDLCNGGHCRPLLLRRDGIERLEATGLPLGLFCGGKYAIRRVELDAGDSLVLYSDGITEAQDGEGKEYGEERLAACLRAHGAQDVAGLASAVLGDVARFAGNAPQRDDITLLIVRRDG